MHIRPATPDDAEAISALVLALSEPFYTHADRAGSERFVASVSPAAERQYIEAENFRFRVAVHDERLLGVIALRDGTHLFHLFVAVYARFGFEPSGAVAQSDGVTFQPMVREAERSPAGG